MGYLLLSLLVVISGHLYMIYTVDALCSSGFSGSSCHKENIAFNRSTRQSSLFQPYASKLAVDGNSNINQKAGSCTHTDDDGQSSWSVLLDPQKEHNITNVTLYLRDMHASRYKNLLVTVDSVLCGRGNITNANDLSEDAAPTPNPVLLRCHPPLRGHNVTVLVNNGYLSLCEVQIWVCQDGWFGDDCSESCRCNDTSEVCDKLTGFCRSGCSSGREGRGCQIACTNKTYGPECSLTCGHCLNSSPCDPVTGLCSRCDPGWETGKCDRTCTYTTYGPGCSLKCGHCLNSSPCDPVTGYCSRGCDSGWRTKTCDESCGKNTHGPGCSLTCGHCLNSSSCDPVTGLCSSGCDQGWETARCDRSCSNNAYGPGCLNDCGHCLNSSCDPVTGSCSSGCDSGWESEKCDETCDNNMYGPGCSKECGHCLNSSYCDPVTGLCSSGCDPGWERGKCDRFAVANAETVVPFIPYLVWAIVATVMVLILLLVQVLLHFRRHHRRQNTSNTQDPAGTVDMTDTTHCNQYEDLQTRGQDNPYWELDLQNNKSGIETNNPNVNQ